MKLNTKTIAMWFTIALMLSTFLASTMNVNLASAQPVSDTPTLDPLSIPKYTDQLVIPPVYKPKNIYDWCGNLIRQEYTVTMSEFYQQILPEGFPQTLVWGYGGYAKDAVTGKYLGFVRNTPAPSFETTRGVPIRVKWINELTKQMLPVDPTMHWANPNNMTMMDMNDMDMEMDMTFPVFPPGFEDAQQPVPTVVHVHGLEVESSFDGGPDQWWTADGIRGSDYRSLFPTSKNAAIYQYPNIQLASTLWYHDHALGITRINVLSGLAGFYLIRDKADKIASLLPRGKYEIPIAIQDRSFNDDGSLWFPSVGVNPEVHPYWQPEFFGNTIMVNGKLWPNLNVDQGQYRFRVLDGSNARFYNLTLVVQGTGQILPFTLIGTDGGYIKSATEMASILIAPGQRDDILVDFSGLPAGTRIVMTNDANAPFPDGDPVDPDTTGQIMQFTVTSNTGKAACALPNILNPTLAAAYPTLQNPDGIRTLPFFEQMGDNGPLGVFLNGQQWSGTLTETPIVGSTEDWLLVNPTADTHPIHLHLVQFQLAYRQPFDAATYEEDWMTLNGMVPLPVDQIPTVLPVRPYLTGPEEYPAAEEMAWRDTIIAPTGYVTVIRVRWAPQDQPTTGLSAPIAGLNTYAFDPTKGPGYVWHCHIVDHEDNEMMRPYKVVNSPNPILQVKVYDMDKSGEFRVLVDGTQIFRSSTSSSKNNRWTTLNLDLSPYVTSGLNVVTLKNPTWDYCRIDDVRIIVNGISIVKDLTPRNLQHTSRQYTFSV